MARSKAAPKWAVLGPLSKRPFGTAGTREGIPGEVLTPFSVPTMWTHTIPLQLWSLEEG